MPGTSNPIATDVPMMFGSTPTRATYRELIKRGFGSTEAANLVAHLAGLRVGTTPWTLAEINRVLFLRHLFQSGRAAEARASLELPSAT